MARSQAGLLSECIIHVKVYCETFLQGAWCGLQVDGGGALNMSGQRSHMDGTTSLGHIRSGRSSDGYHSWSGSSDNNRRGSGTLHQNGASW